MCLYQVSIRDHRILCVIYSKIGMGFLTVVIAEAAF